MMIAGRVLQGIGVAAPRIVTIAMVRDRYEGRQMARLMSLAMSIFILVPTVAPALGQAILWIGDWRSIFAAILSVAALALVWFWLRQPETLPAARRLPLSFLAVARAALEVVRSRVALSYTLATGFVFAPFLAYLSSCEQILRDVYDAGSLFALWFGVLSLAFGCASLLNGRLVVEHGMRRLARAAALTMTVVSTAFLALSFAFAGVPAFWLLMAYLLAVFFCIGLLFGNLNALAMEPLGHIAGVGAAVVASLTTLHRTTARSSRGSELRRDYVLADHRLRPGGRGGSLGYPAGGGVAPGLAPTLAEAPRRTLGVRGCSLASTERREAPGWRGATKGQ